MELPKSYDPSKYEADIYKMWEDSGAFKPVMRHGSRVQRIKPESETRDKKLETLNEPPTAQFSIIMPPPNANGNIHVGTAMFTIEDIMVRYHRMKGDATLWLPGTDHAGIETQVVFERELAKQGKDRFDFGPVKFYEAMMAYTRDKQSTIISELKSMGFSADWSRLKFTLDPDIVKIVYSTFKQLHDDGLIYRGNRIVNWCTRCQSSFADIEIKYEEREDAIYTLNYGPIQIATTRPETIYADSAVAVNPSDPRYTHLIGQTATVPLIDRPVPIIADDHVDPKFGTGALKVTPGHDPNDFDIGQRHNLPQISVIDLEGKMINTPEDILGLTVEQARTKTVELLEKSRKLIKTKALRHSVGVHGRCSTVIEPLVTEQWWLKVKPLIEPAVDAIKSGEIKIVPARSTKTAISWLENLHDWNISRQIWWGIRIPVYYGTEAGMNQSGATKQPYLVADREQEAIDYYGAGNYRAETDTFDTWFSSGQWPFATLGFPGSDDFKQFYPTSVMETGRDILFLWVTRMIMLGLYRTGRVPFKTIYLHGMVNDEHGKKMSKSKGNVINPLEFTKKYGTDALRLALTIGISPGNDGALGEKKVEGYRNFNNKLWNVARFILANVTSHASLVASKASLLTSDERRDTSDLSLADKWMLDRLSSTIKSVTKAIEAYRFSEAGQQVYSLLWDDFADWYLESSKSSINQSVLIYGLETILKLTHPFAPFVTEAIWQQMPWQSEALIISPWPEAGKSYPQEARQFGEVQQIVNGVRGLSRALPASGRPKVLMGEQDFDKLGGVRNLIARLCNTESIEPVKQGRGLTLTSTKHQIWLDIKPEIIAEYLSKLKADKADKLRYIAEQDALLQNQRFMASAPEQVKQQKADSKAQAELVLSKLDEQIKTIRSQL